MSRNFVASGNLSIYSGNHDVINILVDYISNGVTSWDYDFYFSLPRPNKDSVSYSFNGTSADMFSDEFMGDIKKSLVREYGDKAWELINILEANEFSLLFKMTEYNAGIMFLAEEEFYIRHKAGVPLEDTIADEYEFYREHCFTEKNLLDIADEDPEVVEGLFAC